MKTLLLILIQFPLVGFLSAQNDNIHANKQKIIDLISQYGQARVDKDTEALKNILVSEIDQLVSTGEWRRGIDESLAGMLRSSTRQPGSRSLTVEEVRFLSHSRCPLCD
jgi:hypothetical protein